MRATIKTSLDYYADHLKPVHRVQYNGQGMCCGRSSL